MAAPRRIYAKKALSQLPRLLGNLDRTPFSPTYGCFHRDYWLDKTSDFPDAVRQFAVHALAMAYRCDIPDNPYHGETKIREWTVAGLDFWTKIQHGDGSFDEFYPYERGWVGPTAFTTFTSIEALALLGDEAPQDVAARVREAVRKAAYFICEGESEEDHLANHHAMACLAVWKAYEMLGEPALRQGFDDLWQGFKSYHHFEEGWSREYDGIDPGYLSATVSFLGKIYQTDPPSGLKGEIREVLRSSVETCSYFAYPNGSYGGSIGSRNTLHFYPHGFEIMAGEMPMAAAVAERLLAGLGAGKLVPPEIISDRYVGYRVPEFLQSYLDYTERPGDLPPLPSEQEGLAEYMPDARIHASTEPQRYVVANLAKGGVVKVFDRDEGRLLYNDSGIIGRLADGRVVTSQWVDPDYTDEVEEGAWVVEGALHVVPSNKLFTPFKNILFRSALIGMGWKKEFSHWLKGTIRKTLMLGTRPVPVRFRRRLAFEDGGLVLTDELHLEDSSIEFASLAAGDEFYVRYVPQSRYFQQQELGIEGWTATPGELRTLHRTGRLERRMRVTADGEVTREKEKGEVATVASTR